MIEPRPRNLLRATSINQLGMTERHTPPATNRRCPDCGCRISRYTPWTQSRCCPCDAKHTRLVVPKCRQCGLPLAPPVANGKRYCDVICRRKAELKRRHEAA